MPAKKAPSSTFQLKIVLMGILPPSGGAFRFPVRSRCDLHDTLQAVMGWRNSHLHLFQKDGKRWGVPQYHGDHGLEVMDE
jgi:hypothetical protein